MLLYDRHFHEVYGSPSTVLRLSLNIRGSDERPASRYYFSETTQSAPRILYPRFQICSKALKMIWTFIFTELLAVGILE